jgi:hypothetical protein
VFVKIYEVLDSEYEMNSAFVLTHDVVIRHCPFIVRPSLYIRNALYAVVYSQKYHAIIRRFCLEYTLTLDSQTLIKMHALKHSTVNYVLLYFLLRTTDLSTYCTFVYVFCIGHYSICRYCK